MATPGLRRLGKSGADSATGPMDGTDWETEELPEPSPSIRFVPLLVVAPSCGFEPQTTRLTVGGSTGLSYDGPRGHTGEGLK